MTPSGGAGGGARVIPFPRRPRYRYDSEVDGERSFLMPKERWTGYHRFCPLARGLDIVGERWTLPILHELLFRPLRYGELLRRLPGVSPNLVADRLRKLEGVGLVERGAPGPGDPVSYRLTEAGRGLEPVFVALRRWGVEYLVGDTAEDEEPPCFDMSFVEGVEAIGREVYEWRIDDDVFHLEIDGGVLRKLPGRARRPAVTVTTGRPFIERWAAGQTGWDEGRDRGEVAVEGSEEAWRRMLAATGYLRSYEPAEGDQLPR